MASLRTLNAAVALSAACWGLASAPDAFGQAQEDVLPGSHVARGSNHITHAWLTEPTARYRHFVLGAQYEAASLTVALLDGRTLALRLPATSVFEDRRPRLADLDGDGRDEVVVVRSYLDRGAALAVVGVRGGKLGIVAETPPIGVPHRWLNPAGIADFDGDGRLDVAYVQMPHVLGRLRVWTLGPQGLTEIASMADTSNHALGSGQLGLAAVADFDGDGVSDLAIASLDRRTLRFLAFKGGARELARRELPSPAVSDFAVEFQDGKPVVVVGLGAGKNVKVRYETR